MQRCSKCHTVKPFSDFFRVHTARSGYRSWCKTCSQGHAVIPKARTIEEGFSRYVPQLPPDQCWPWTGPTTKGGYGTFSFETRDRYAHRVAWELHHGPIPEALCVLHHCDRRSCVNWTRCLFLGTNMDNILDSILKGRNLTPLMPDDVRLMRTLRQEGETLETLAQLFHVSNHTVSDICAYKRWKHL